MKNKRIVLAAWIVAGMLTVCMTLTGHLYIRASEVEETQGFLEDALEGDVLQGEEFSEEMSGDNELYYQGLRYYLDSYRNEQKILYLQACLACAEMETAAAREMCEVGEMTAAEVKGSEAKEAWIKAQIKEAENQCSYDNLFLQENNLDYHSYDIKEMKDVKETDEYIALFPAKNHMTIAGYVTDYKNALVYMEAKEPEIEFLTMQTDSSRLLYEEGEISKLQWKQQEASLAKAVYEQEQYYVEMNLAYASLMLYCR